MDGITIITGPRTGAGHLLKLLGNFAELAPNGELFDALGQDIPGMLDLAELEARSSGKRVLAVKVTSALAAETVQRDILGRPGMRAMLLVRRQIDSYVSLAKAMALDTWRDFDTTAVKVKIDPERFARWMETETAWYAGWRDWLTRRALPVPILRYETHVDIPAEVMLRRFSVVAAQLGIALKLPLDLRVTGLIRQDQGKAIADKVRDWPDVSKALIAMGLEKQAFGYPI